VKYPESFNEICKEKYRIQYHPYFLSYSSIARQRFRIYFQLPPPFIVDKALVLEISGKEIII
jgi:hypothetical protein